MLMTLFRKKPKISVRKDGEGYLAEVGGSKSLYAFGYSEEEALNELQNVIDMEIDFELELIESQRRAKWFVNQTLQRLRHAV